MVCPWLSSGDLDGKGEVETVLLLGDAKGKILASAEAPRLMGGRARGGFGAESRAIVSDEGERLMGDTAAAFTCA